MIDQSCDFLPHTRATAALVRRLVWKLDGQLATFGHPILTMNERASFFVLAEASKVLDRLAVLPGMAQVENTARDRLLELYNIFYPERFAPTLAQPAPVGMNPTT